MLDAMRNQHIGSVYQQSSKQYVLFPIHKMTLIGASNNFGLVRYIIGK